MPPAATTLPDLVHEVFGEEIIELVHNQHRLDLVPYAGFYERWPTPIAALKIVRSALQTACQIHGEIPKPEWHLVDSTGQQIELLLAFLDLDAAMVGIRGHVRSCHDEYMKASLGDPPIDDWCGFGGGNPVEVAFNYAGHIHGRVIKAMIPRGSTLTSQEQADEAALLQRRLNPILTSLRSTPCKWRLPPELVMRRLAVAMPLPSFHGESPGPDDLNKLLERLDRIESRLTQPEPGTVGKLGEATEGRELHIENWTPPLGMIGAKALHRDHKLPRSTLADWVKKDDPEVVADPKTGEQYVSIEWAERRMARWHQGKTTPLAER